MSALTQLKTARWQISYRCACKWVGKSTPPCGASSNPPHADVCQSARYRLGFSRMLASTVARQQDSGSRAF